MVRRLVDSPYPLRSLLGVPRRLAELDAGPGRPRRAGLRDRPAHHGHRGRVPPQPRRARGGRPGRRRRTWTRCCARRGWWPCWRAVNDHENLGALFRNAAALGVDAVLLGPRCADPLYRRSVRVSMGHVLRVPFAELPGPWPAALDRLRAAGLRVAALTPGPDAVPLTGTAVGSRAGGAAARRGGAGAVGGGAGRGGRPGADPDGAGRRLAQRGHRGRRGLPRGPADRRLNGARCRTGDRWGTDRARGASQPEDPPLPAALRQALREWRALAETVARSGGPEEHEVVRRRGRLLASRVADVLGRPVEFVDPATGVAESIDDAARPDPAPRRRAEPPRGPPDCRWPRSPRSW